MKKSIKNLIIILLIITIICLIILAIVSKNKQNINTDLDKPTLPDKRYTETKEKYECNEFEFININTEDLIKMYFDRYNEYELNNVKKAYSLLDKEYREKRFGDINGYKAYVEENREKIASNTLESYKIEVDDDKTRYICIDQNGNYYIFTENAIMDYTVILDTYTTDLPEFTEKYNNGTEQQKVALNIEKFIQAVNTKDYKYAYNCLADSFKNNYFKTQAEFENYARENFYENSTVEYNQFEVQGDIYTYSVILKDKISGEQKTKTFIMKLGEETDFEMSFNR